MRVEHRKSRRRPICYVAWVATGPDARQDCLLSDMSETGARIDIPDADEIPDRFVLLLTANGAARRTCRVVWRKAHQIGVRFERPAVDGKHVGLVPEPADGAETPAAAPTEAAASR